jgi:hypothetical protein
MELDPQSSKYTAFNTCFGTFKFQRLPMGLSSSPNSFHTGGGLIPSLEMWCLRNTQELFAKEHFFGLNFNPALRKRVKMSFKLDN